MRINCTGLTILAVDDDFNSLLLLTELLQDSGCFILTANNGKSTMEIIESMHVDLILLDIKLADTNGYELIGKIKHVQPKIQSIAQTAITLELASTYQDAGFDDFIYKPISSAMLFSKIETLLCHTHVSKNI